MTLFDILLLAVALSMDAFAVAVCKGLALGKVTARQALTVGLWFGGFQALMPTLGYLLGAAFASLVCAYVPWIAFALLTLIGINMIREAFECEEKADTSLTVKAMLPLALATSIDALATGITLVMLSPALVCVAVLSIGIVTLSLSALGCRVGAHFGTKCRERAVLLGGTVLILLGIKIVLSSYGLLPF